MEKEEAFPKKTNLIPTKRASVAVLFFVSCSGVSRKNDGNSNFPKIKIPRPYEM